MAWRPTKMCERYIEMIWEYLKTVSEEWEVLEKSSSSSSQGSSESVENKLKVNLPTFAWLLEYFDSEWYDISEETLHAWQRKWKEWKEKDDLFVKFSESLRKVMRKQERMILDWSISGRYNPLIAKMLLNVNHGYKEVEKKEVTFDWNIKVWEIKEMTTEEILKQIEEDEKEEKEKE